MPIWEVHLSVEGPIAVRNRIRMETQKGFRVDDPFYSDVEIEARPMTGFRSVITARADSSEAASQAAMVFFGQMLDALALSVNKPMILYGPLTEREGGARQRQEVRRVIDRLEIEAAFAEATFLRSGSPSFLRALGWYRKGLSTEDPFDAYLALWNAIELVASKYYRYVPTIDQDRARAGSKSQLWECFKALWGDCSQWPVIGDNVNWIDCGYDIRTDVAHGRCSITIDDIAHVAREIPTLSNVAYLFLSQWRSRFLELERNPPHEEMPIR
jgi:hypothetical protein